MDDHSRPALKWKLRPDEVRGAADAPSPTICEAWRRVWRIADHIEPEDPLSARRLKDEAERGYDMGKRMDDALRAYKVGKEPHPSNIVDNAE